MKGRTTLVLAVCILVMGGVIWIQETVRGRHAAKASEEIRLFTINAETVSFLQFQCTNMVVDCVKQNGVWMTGDASRGLGRADVAQVQQLIAGLGAMGKGTTITAENRKIRKLDIEEYGFDHPSIRITAVDAEGRRVWLVGRKTPLGDMLYAKTLEGNDIYTIPAVLLKIVPQSLDQLRDRVVFAGDPASIRRLELRGSGGFLQMVRDPKSGWQMQQPVVSQADQAKMAAFIDQLFQLRIDSFVADNVSDFSVYGLQGSARQISIGNADGSSRMLALGDEIPGSTNNVYARRAADTSVFAMPKKALDLLNFSPDDFRDRSLLSLPADAVSSVTIARGAERLELVRQGPDAWWVAQPVDWAASAEEVDRLVKLWSEAFIVDFNAKDARARAGDAAVDWVLEFGSESLAKTNTLKVVDLGGNGVLVRRAKENIDCQINLPRMPVAMIDPLSYKDRQVLNFDAKDIQKLSLQREGGVSRSIERQSDGSFAFAETTGGSVPDAAAVAQMAARLSRLQAQQYVTYNPRDLATYGLDRPGMELHIGLAGTNQMGRVLLVGQPVDNGCYAMVQGQDVVFILSRQDVDALDGSPLFATNSVGTGAK